MKNSIADVINWMQMILGIASVFIAGAGFVCLAVGFNFIWLCVMGFNLDCQIARALLVSGCVLLINAAVVSGIHKFLDRWA